MATQTTTSPALDHFLDLAYQGRRIGASGGEKAARKMALAMLDHGLRLDGLAVEGLVEFIRAAIELPGTQLRKITDVEGLIKFIRAAKNAPQTARDPIGA